MLLWIQPVNVNPFKPALGSPFSTEIASIATSDQPGKPATAIFETMEKYLQKHDTSSEVMIFTQKTLKPPMQK